MEDVKVCNLKNVFGGRKNVGKNDFVLWRQFAP